MATPACSSSSSPSPDGAGGNGCAAPTAAGHALAVRRLGANGRIAALLALAVAWPAVALFLRRFTDTDVPWWDAFPTAASVLGQWLLGRKYVENWPTWIVVNVAATALFAYKGLWLTVVLYAIFIVLSFVGWRAWRRLLPDHQVPT